MSTLVTHPVPMIGLRTHTSRSDGQLTGPEPRLAPAPLTLASPSLCRASPRWK